LAPPGRPARAALLDLRADLDSVRIEIETLRRFIESQNESFASAYREIRDAVVHGSDPEFGTGRRGD
jgi:hypothetical protein